ncbi:hypothetical protein [Mucilaginibacter sp. CSA2-8R]|uniref:hypothetical protein n=1 Tax=Mucilaginibacter sp. CSA2-8R TaxID=3141542 RepID=UPI00315D1478
MTDDDFTTSYAYDDAGNLLEETQAHSSSGNLFSKIAYSYINRQKATSKQYEYIGKVERLRYSSSFEYDHKSRLTKEIKDNYTLYPSTLAIYSSETITYTYDSNNNLLSKSTFNSAGRLLSSDEYHFDSFNRKIKYISRSEHHEFDYQEEYEYNRKGQLAKITNSDLNGSKNHELKRIYDKAGNEITLLGYNNKTGKVSKTVYEYNALNQVSVETDYLEDDLNTKKVYEYDKAGNKTSQTHFNKTGSKVVSIQDSIEYY